MWRRNATGKYMHRRNFLQFLSLGNFRCIAWSSSELICVGAKASV
uniref:Uncharacterized protein n=1 Tax=Arundo donax TaxID=35708 RepID=A0A0A9FID1_ARUDO